jgi:hypothetical protein
VFGKKMVLGKVLNKAGIDLSATYMKAQERQQPLI